jgi:hypothetical protein
VAEPKQAPARRRTAPRKTQQQTNKLPEPQPVNYPGWDVEPDSDERIARLLQAGGEDLAVPQVVEGDALPKEVITFAGQEFRIRPRIASIALLRYAAASKAGIDSDTSEGLAANYAMLKGCIARDEWARFEALAMDEDPEPEDLFGVVNQAVELYAARPTGRPSDSSPGPQAISGSSKAGTSYLEQREAARFQGLRAV